MADFKDIICSQKECKQTDRWEGTVLDYLYKAKETPEITNFAPSRIYNMIIDKGTDSVDDSLKLRGYDDLVHYKFFDNKIFGTLESLHDIMKFLKAAARRTETGKRILILVGPVSSGKSTIAALVKRGLEDDPTLKYALKGCPLHEEPMHVIPKADREFWEKELGVRIEGDLCPVCQQSMDESHTGDDGVVHWEEIEVESLKFSEQRRLGIGTFQPSDPKCVKYNTILFSEQGMLTFNELQEKLLVNINCSKSFEIDISGVEGTERTSTFYNNGIQHINNIKTRFGFDIDCTDAHPILVLEDGKMLWKKAEEIEVGDFIGIQKGQNLFGNNPLVGVNISKVLGYLVAEGSITPTDIWFSNNSDVIIEDYCSAFIKAFGNTPKTYGDKSKGKRNTVVSSMDLSEELINKFGMKTGSYNKEMPQCIRTANKECIIGFLEALFMGDGHVSTRKDMCSNYFKYDTVSKVLAKQVQMALLNLGIVSSFNPSYVMNYNGNFVHSITVHGDGVLDLLELMPFLNSKKTDTGDFIEGRGNTNYDSIPNVGILFDVVFDDVRDAGHVVYKTDIVKYDRYRYGSTKSWGRNPSRFKVLEFIEAAENLLGKNIEACNSLREILDTNLLWMPVTEKSDGGFDQVYDVTVPKTHSFCANGIMNHNSQDVTELIGRVNMSKVARFGDTDPRAFQFNGELQVANGGVIEMVELLKTDIKLQYVLMSLAQEQVIKSPGFPQIYIDTLMLAHTNQTEFDKFKAAKENEALHDRMYPVFVPWNLRVSDEIKIYQKMINDSDFRDIHIAPHTLKVAAQFAVLSRMTDSTKVSNKIEKMKLYNGEVTEGFKKSDIDLKALRQEGRDKSEGMSGISPRFIINALNVALGSKEKKKCVNPIDIIRYLRDNFDHHIGIAEEDKDRFINLLIGDKDSVSSDYKEVAKKETNMAFLYAYEEQAMTLFDNYMRNITSFCKKEKVYDSITGEYSDADEKLMRSIEELIPVPESSKSEFRNGVFVHKSTALERGKKFTYKEYPPLKDAIEKKLMSDLKPVVSLSLADTTTTDPKAKKRRGKALETLLDNGYCKECAAVLLAFIGEVLRKEE
jgi:predicted Ser/Thr protein kinase/intein/homing endonuclease